MNIEKELAHGYDLHSTGQCISRIYELKPGKSSTSLVFTGTGAVWLVIGADASSNAAVQLAVFNAQGQRIWATWPSTRIVGTYTVDLKAPGFYDLVIENPSSNTADASFTAILNVVMCGGPAVEYWLRRYIKSAIDYAPLNGVKIPMAPVGIASYGVMEVDGQYLTYTLTTDAVKGVVYIPSNISVFGYYWNGSYRYYGQAFSVQLNAFVVARLTDGTAQYYWIQNIVGFDEHHKGLEVWNNIWNLTTAPSILDNSTVKGNGAVYCLEPDHRDCYYKYVMPGSIPFGRVELEMWARADGGKIIVEFYANGRRYDKVIITPYAPATSAHIEIAPATTPTGHPLNLELVFGGRDDRIPLAILKRGRIGLELYVHMNNEWIPPPSAWSVGYVTDEASHASVVPQGVGSALVVPGAPNLQQLLLNPIMKSIIYEQNIRATAVALVLFLLLDGFNRFLDEFRSIIFLVPDGQRRRGE